MDVGAFEMLPRPVYYRALGGHVERQCTTSWPDLGTMGFIQSRRDEPGSAQEIPPNLELR